MPPNFPSRLSGYSLQDVERVVKHNEKQRFAMKRIGGEWAIRANQGHSISGVNPDLTPIVIGQNIQDYPKYVVHATYFKFWGSILSQGLSRMSRNQIHFAKGKREIGQMGEIPGMRKDCDVYIFVDMEQAITGYYQLYCTIKSFPNSNIKKF